MEIVKVLVLFIIAIEGALLLYKKEEVKESERTTRRDVYGTFKDPLGDSYRKNTRGHYVPIKPGEKMLEGLGDDEE